MFALAPVGTALLGYRKGDIAEWDVPSGEKKFLIKDIIYQPEANGEDIVIEIILVYCVRSKI